MDLTLGQIIVKTAILQVVFVLIKLAFFNYLNGDLLPIIIAFYILVIAATTAVARRFGDTNYFESFLIILVWLVVTFLVDVIITAPLSKDGIFTNIHLWFSYLAMIVAVIVFDRKEHVALRKAGN